jgi:hypothetical protein
MLMGASERASKHRAGFGTVHDACTSAQNSTAVQQRNGRSGECKPREPILECGACRQMKDRREVVLGRSEALFT